MSGPHGFASRPSEAELAALAQAGDADAWNEIARRHTRRVVISLLASGYSLELAEDLTQETWMRLMKLQREGLLRDLRFPGLAIAQAAWLAREAERTRRRREGIVGSAGVSWLSTETGEELASEIDPEQLAIDRERLELVEQELSRCPVRAQQVFRAVYGAAGESHAEVARTTGLSIQRVRQIICEVRARLRSALDSQERPWNT